MTRPRGRPPKHRKALTVFVEPALTEAAKAARRKGESLSDLIDEALRQHLASRPAQPATLAPCSDVEPA